MMTEKAEWKLNGQTLNITLQVSDTVATMKALIHEQTGMPPGKQKLQYEVRDKLHVSTFSFVVSYLTINICISGNVLQRQQYSCIL